MENTLHDHQDDSSTLDEKKRSHLEETTKNHGQYQDQTLVNISPQGEKLRILRLPINRSVLGNVS